MIQSKFLINKWPIFPYSHWLTSQLEKPLMYIVFSAILSLVASIFIAALGTVDQSYDKSFVLLNLIYQNLKFIFLRYIRTWYLNASSKYFFFDSCLID